MKDSVGKSRTQVKSLSYIKLFLEGAEGGFEGIEVGEIFGVIFDIGEADDALFIDEEGGAFGDAAHDEVGFGEELVVGDAVGFGGGVFVVAEEGDGDAFFLCPSVLGEGVVTGDAEDFRVEILVFVDAGGDVAEFRGADAGEGHGDEE